MKRHDERIRTILDEAIDLPSERRGPYLDASCSGDGALRARVQELLDAHDRAGGFLAGEGGDSVSRGSPGGSPGSGILERGTAIGRYRLVEPIGEGGFGTVYRAEQTEPVRREVALKLLKPGMDSRQVVARFQAERQALARMDHPGIAKVLDGGATDAGLPYFVMELVPGRPITEHCDAERLPLRARLELFVRVCQAVQHAHLKGIVHRDLKSSNVLVATVDGEPLPRVIDFGVAKAVEGRGEGTALTGIRQVVGTLETMAPEQAEGGDVDTRADVYALGGLLYELVTGYRPIEARSSSHHELLRVLREVDPVRPSSRVAGLGEGALEAARRRRTTPGALARRLSGDLDWIALKALEKRRERRYATAEALAADVRRHLDDEPVSARPPGAADRLAKLYRRNRVAFVSGTGAAAALLAGLALALSGLARARTERDRAEVQAGVASEILEFLNRDLLASVAPGKKGRDATVREALDAAADRIAGRFPDQPLVEAAVRSTLGDTYRRLGLQREAEVHLGRALELTRAAAGEEDERTLEAKNDLGGVLRERGRYDEAAALLEEALAVRRRRLGDDHVDTLTSINNLGLLYADCGRWERAEALCREVVAKRLATLGEEHEHTLASMSNLAILLERLGRYEEAEEWTVRELEVCRRVLGEDHPDTFTSRNNLAALYGSMRRFDEAVDVLEELLEAEERVLGPEHPETIDALVNLASARYQGGEPREGERIARLALERGEALGDDHPTRLHALLALAVMVSRAGRFTDAEELFALAIDGGRRTFGDAHPDTLRALVGLAENLESQGAFGQAEEVYAEAVEAAEALPPGNDHLWQALTAFGRCLGRNGRPEEAEAALTRARELTAAGSAQEGMVDRELARLSGARARPEE